MLFMTPSIGTQAAPAGYDQYGDLSEEIYQDDLQLLAMLVYHEAGNQDLQGKRLVVDTVLNRLDSGLCGSTIREVIEQPGQFTTVKYLDTVTDECYQAVLMETGPSNSRLDSRVFFFVPNGYSSYGIPAYKYGGHYFSYYE